MTEATLPGEPALPPVRSFARRARSIAGYVFLVTLMLTASSLVIFLPAALLHCGIRNGRRSAWFVLAAAATVMLLVISLGSLSPQAVAAMNSAVAYQLGQVLMIGIPALLVLPLVERGERFGRVLLFALLIGAAGMMATEVIMRAAAAYSPYTDQIAVLRDFFAKFLDANAKGGVPADTIRSLRKATNLSLYVEPASLLMYAGLSFIFSLMLLGRTPAWRRHVEGRNLPMATQYLFRHLSLPDWLLFGFVLGGVSPLLSGLPQKIGANLLAVVVFLYFLQGLAIFRWYMAMVTGAFALFAWTALGLLMITGIPQVLLGVAGLFDSFFDFRHFNRKDHPDESHSH